jgi:uncharacterized membrane protein
MKLHLSRPAWIAIAVVAILLLILLIISPNVLQIALSVPLVLFLPGFGLTLILFPWDSLGIPERLVLSVGLSIAFTALSGLILNLTPWGLQAKTLWIAVILCIAIEIAVMFFTRPVGRTNAKTFLRSINFNMRQWIFISLAALITIMAIQMARTPTSPGGLAGYTLLSAQAGDTSDTIRLGVRSEEFKQTKYQIKYQYNGITHKGPMLALKPGETWEQVVPIPIKDLTGKSFTVLLYRLDNPTQVYRYVEWWPENN